LTDAFPGLKLCNMGSRSGIKNYRVSFNFYITPGVQWLVVVTFAVFFLQVLIRVFAGPFAHQKMLLWFGLVPSGVFPGLRIWQPFTYLFLHDPNDFLHVLFNMLMLWMFGRELELVWGKARFIRYYFLTGVGAGLIEVLVKAVPTFFGRAPSDIPTIGASGAIFGIFAACAILFPDRQVSIFFLPIRMSMRSFVLALAAMEFFLPLLLRSAGDNVSHICHLGGMLIGWLYLRRGSFLYGVRNTVTDWQYRRNRKRFEVYINKQKKEPPSRPDNWVN
jgi:membrane associated rhomboid family serine protease